MTKQDYRRKLGSMILQRMAIEEKMAQAETRRKEECAAGEYNGPATILYFALFDERYAINRNIGKLEAKYLKEGFTVQQWCKEYNMYVDMYRMEVK